MALRVLAAALILIGVALLAVAGIDFFRAEDGPGVTVEATEQEVAATVGGTTDIAIRLSNPTRHRVTVVGLASRDERNCHVTAKNEPPLDLPPGGNAVVEFTLQDARRGPFEAQLCVYLDDCGLRESAVTVRGEARPAGTDPK